MNTIRKALASTEQSIRQHCLRQCEDLDIETLQELFNPEKVEDAFELVYNLRNHTKYPLQAFESIAILGIFAKNDVPFAKELTFLNLDSLDNYPDCPVPRQIEYFTNLTSLSVGEIELNNKASAEQILHNISMVPSLQKLDLRRIKVWGDYGEDSINVPQEFSRLTNLEVLILGENAIGAPHYDCSPSSLKTLKHISTFEKLERLQLSSKNLDYLPTELGNLSGLKDLELSWSFCHSGVIPSWINSLSKLECLGLASMNGGDDFEDFTWPSWSLTFKDWSPSPTVIELDLSSNASEEIDFVELARVFPNLKTLDLSYNCFTHLSRNIASLVHLEVLNISSNERYVDGEYVKLTSLPSELFSLPNLRRVEIDDTIDVTNVDENEWRCSHNQLLERKVYLPDTVRETTSLDIRRFLEEKANWSSENFQAITHLNLQYWKEKELPREIPNFHSVDEITCQCAHLSSLQKYISRFPNLRNIHLWYDIEQYPLPKFFENKKKQGQIDIQYFRSF